MTLTNDIRVALRSLRRSPGFTLAAVTTLALGIGANTAIFSVIDGVLLRPTPFPRLDRLAMVWETDRKSGTTREPASVPDFQDFQQQSRRFSELAAFTAQEVSLTPEGAEPSRLAALAVSHEYLDLTGIHPIIGRGFSPEDDRPGGAQVVLIGEALWQQLYSRDPQVVGRTIRIDDVQQTIIGVVPSPADFGTLQVLSAADYGKGFAARGGQVRVDLWMPLRPDPESYPRDTHPIFVMGRLAGVESVGAAQQEMGAIAADLEHKYPVNDARGVFIEPLSRVVFGPVRPALFVLMGAVALVLLVACANVASLLLARGAERLREVTVRTALGATTRHLVRQFLIESFLLTGAGALLGLVLAQEGLDLLLALAPGDIPRVGTVDIDGRVLAVTLGVTVFIAVCFSLFPTFQASRVNLQSALQGEASRSASAGRRHRRFRSGLVISELALAVMLMTGAGVLIRSLWRLREVDPGFNSAGVLKAEFQLPASRYPTDYAKWPNWPATHGFNNELQRRVTALPGVETVTIAGNHPLDAGFTNSIRVVGREAEAEDWPEPTIRQVDPQYLSTLRVSLLAGRNFDQTDGANGTPVVMINESARRRFFGVLPPLGQQISFWGAKRTIVGVVGNERFHGLAEDSPPSIYLPRAQAPGSGGSLLVRTTSGDPAALAPAIRRIVADLDPSLPLFGVEPLSRTLSNSMGQRRFTMVVLGAFAAVALLLAMVGVHGVLSYTVTQRTREIGIRMALGADRARVRSLILSQGGALVAGGLILGLIGAFAITRLLRALLFGVSPTDPGTFLGVAVLLALVALVASYLPAARAARVDPAVSLRSE
jgi:putative ABC transport system permease protein